MLHHDAHDLGETAMAHLGFDNRQQIVGLVLVARGVGVARHVKGLAGDDLHVGEQHVEVLRHYAFQRHENMGIRNLQEARYAESDRHLDARPQFVLAVAVT
jgi:hypothetical protein